LYDVNSFATASVTASAGGDVQRVYKVFNNAMRKFGQKKQQWNLYQNGSS